MAWDADDTQGSLRSQGWLTLGWWRNSSRLRVFWSDMKASRFVLAVALVIGAFVGVADEASNDKVVAVESKNVCMINDRSMANEQIAVEVEGKTYYGCCPMCKERLVKDEASRFAVDPVSGKKVDKAKAVIGALPGAKVLYFESKENLERYNAGARAESK
jgi:YHS domain-containing protein